MSDHQTQAPPLYPITQEDHGGYIVLATFVGICLAMAFWAARLVVRWRKRVRALDDVFLILAFVFAIIQTACVQYAVQYGLGRMRSTNKVDSDRVMKSFYAAQLLSIASQTCSKVSVSLLFATFASFRPFVIANRASIVFVACWSISAMMALAFQCQGPQTWRVEPARCVNLETLNTAIDVVNILSEAGLIILPAAFMPKVQTSWTIRLVVIGSFATRILVIASLIGQALGSHHLAHFDELSWSYTIPTVWMQFTMNASVLTACIPGMQQVLARLRPGMTTLVVSGDGHVNDYSKSSSVFGSAIRGTTARNASNASAFELVKTGSTVRSKISRTERDEDAESIQELTSSHHGNVVAKEISVDSR